MEVTERDLELLKAAAPANSAIYRINGEAVETLYMAPELPALNGMTAEEYRRVSERSALELVLPEDRAALAEAVRRSLDGGVALDCSFRVVHKTLGSVRVRLKARLCGETEGLPLFFAVFASAPAESGASRGFAAFCGGAEGAAELEAFVNNIPVGVGVFSLADGKVVPCVSNRPLRELLGVSYGEEAFKQAAERIPAADTEKMQAAVRGLKNPGETARHVFRYYRRPGETPRWYQMTTRAVECGGGLKFFSCFYDVTAEKEAESAIIQNRRMYEAAAELAQLGIWVYDVREHTITLSDSWSNKADSQTYSIPMVIEDVPNSLSQWVAKQDLEKMTDVYRAIDGGAPTATCEYWYRKQQGVKPRCERIFYTTSFDEEGKPRLAYGVGMDVTAQKQDLENYRQSIKTLMNADPGTLSAYRYDLTRNVRLDGHAADPFIEKIIRSETADGCFAEVAALILNPEERWSYLQKFNRIKLMNAFMAGQTRMDMEYRRSGEDSSIHWVSSSANLIRNPETGSVECVVYGRDVTTRKRDEQIFERVTNQEFDYVAILHLRAKRIEFVKFNAKLASVYHETLDKPGLLFDFDKVREFTAGSWVDREDRAFYLGNSDVNVVRRQLDANGHYEMSLRGHTLAVPDETMCRKIQHYYLNDDKDTVLIIQTDVTEAWKQQQKEAQRAKAEAERVQDIIDSVASGICMLCMPDPDHLTGSFVNLQMFRILGYDPTGSEESRREIETSPQIALYLRDAFVAVCPEDRPRIKNIFHDNYGSKHFDTGSYRVIRKDGSLAWVSQELIFREDSPQGRVFYSTYKVMDKEIELQNRLERQLREEQELRSRADAANEAKSEFLSRMSHDIRTPLNGIIGMTWLARKQQNPPETADCLGKIDTSSKFLLGLINDILDMSKAESNKIELHPEPYPPDEFKNYLEAVFLPLCKDKNQKFEFDVYMPEGCVPMFDKLRINQVVFNLLSNAVKFTPEGGAITYRAHSRLLENGRLAMKIEVQDTGIGMSDRFQQILFEPFSQESRSDVSETRGTGLGLAIAKRMVDKMGGSISVASKIGQGTIFTVELEVACAPPQTSGAGSAGQDAAESAVSLAGKHVLLCEDHPLNQEIAVALLREKQMLVEAAENGQRGVELFKRSSVGFYDAILMDIRMPVMDGYEAAREIRALDRPDAGTVPIIAMTADAFTDDVRKCFEAGMNGHTPKPIDPNVLYEKLEKLMAR